MRFVFVLGALTLAIMISACTAEFAGGEMRPDQETAADTIPDPGNRHPVLVELFTSEGCSSCPPADRNLLFLEKQQPVAGADAITLAFHVDYWDRLGWKDRFSSPLYSQRQEGYAQAFKLASNYTPQMVVDGRTEFVGSDSGRAAKEIAAASSETKASVEIRSTGRRIDVKLTDIPEHSDATVYAALAEDGISSRVERGENSGKTLEHISVVRELKVLGSLETGSGAFEQAVDFGTPADSKADNLKIVVFAQEKESKKIIGVGRVKF